MLKLLFVMYLSLMIGNQSQAHEGHGTPGAIPPAPHGGKVKEAKGGNSHTELFFEAILNGSQLTVYPLGLGEKDSSSFIPLSVSADLKDIEVKVEYPRQKKTEKLNIKLTDTSIETVLPLEKKGRIIVEVAAVFKGSKKTAKVQFE